MYAYQVLQDDFGNYYLYGSAASPTITFDNDAFIAKLDADWNLLWARRLHADEFSYYRMQLSIANNGDAVFSYTTFGHFPIIAGRLSPEGELLDYHGYSAFDPQLAVTDNQEIVFLSERIYEGSTVRRGVLLAKTEPDGTFTNCSTYPACLEVTPLAFPLDTLNWERTEANPLIDLDDEVSITPITATTVDLCGEPDFPSPTFSVPALLCPGDTLTADSLDNALANAVFWQITGNGLDTVLVERTLTYAFADTGTYAVTQYLYVLGCEYTATRTLRVAAPDNLSYLPEDTFVCTDELLIQPITATFPDTTVFRWQDDPAAGRERGLRTNGTYVLEVRVGNCLFIDSLTLTFANQLVPAPAWELPPGDTICGADLPYSLSVAHNYTDRFWIDQDTFSSLEEYSLREAGVYTLNTLLDGCLYQQRFELTVSDCQSDIYLPNAFSPNGDGTNDALEVFGRFFTPRRLRVYDRWGSLVHDTQLPPFRWDGRGLQQRLLDNGIYVVVFEYLNTLSGEVEVLAGDVLMLR